MKHLNNITLLLLFAFACATACFAQNQSPTPASIAHDAAKTSDEGKATVYIYRKKKLIGSALEPSVFCDGVELARMDNGRFFIVKLDPGTHLFHMTDRADKYKRIEIKMGPGEKYYFRIGLEPGMWKGHGTIVQVDEEEATAEIKKLKPLADSKIKDRTRVVAGSTPAQ